MIRLAARVLSSATALILAVAAPVAAQVTASRLADAVEQQDRRTVRELLASGVDVNVAQSDGGTPLHWAAHWNDTETAKLLIESGAHDVEEPQTSRRSPLLVASRSMAATSGLEYLLVVKPSPHEDLALLLLEEGANPNVPDSIGRTPLHAAVETGRPELVKSLLAHGADPNARLTEPPPPLKGDFVGTGRYLGATPLCLAAAARVPDVEILRLLIAGGADPNLGASDGATPLMAAVGMVQNEARQAREAEALALVRYLVGLDIDINATDRRGRTAMHGAARLARNTLIPVLVEHGAELSVADENGQTPLDVGTLSRPLHPDTESLLRSLGATSGKGSR